MRPNKRIPLVLRLLRLSSGHFKLKQLRLTQPTESPKSIVQLRDAAVGQGNRVVLRGLDLSIHAGEFVYLIGRTGTGKSTLLKALYGAVPLSGGEGRVLEFDLNALTRTTLPLLRRSMGMVFQEFNLLYDRSVAANVSFALECTGQHDRAVNAQRVDAMLESVGLGSQQQRMPAQLSGGEQQRLALARALVNHPRLLLADEPTGNLDPETADDVMQLIRRLAHEHGSAVLFVTHDYRLIDQFPGRIFRAREGTVLDERMLNTL